MSGFSIRAAQPEDRPGLKALWKQGFGDSDEYIDAFFDRFLREDGCVAAEAEGRIVSAMYVVGGCAVHPYRREHLSVGYTYALATLPAYRGRGIGSAVYKAASDLALARADASCVVPAEPGLFPFYEKAAGASVLCSIREARIRRLELGDSVPVMAARLPADQYAGMREAILSGMPHATFPIELFELMEETGTEFFILEHGIAAAETSDDVCRVIELLDPEGDGRNALAGVARWCRAEEYIVRTPLFFDGPGERRPLVMSVLKRVPDFPLAEDLWWGFDLS